MVVVSTFLQKEILKGKTKEKILAWFNYKYMDYLLWVAM